MKNIIIRREIYMGNSLGFGSRNLNFENHWEELEIEDYNSKGVVLLCLGGNQTCTSTTATRVCATAERFVGLKLGEEQSSYKYVDLLGFYYTTKIPNSNGLTEIKNSSLNASTVFPAKSAATALI